MNETSSFEQIAKAWRKRFGAPMPVAGELQTAWEILTESGVDLPPPPPAPPPVEAEKPPPLPNQDTLENG